MLKMDLCYFEYYDLGKDFVFVIKYRVRRVRTGWGLIGWERGWTYMWTG